jgi:CRP-like cAMP-binding protein
VYPRIPEFIADSPVPFLARLTADGRAQIARLGAVQEFDAAAELWHEGDQPTHVIVVLEGFVRLTTTSWTYGGAGWTDWFGPGDLVGESEATDEMPRLGHLSVLRPGARCLTIEAKKLRLAMRNRPELAHQLYKTTALRLRATIARQAEFSGATGAGRVALVLLDLANRPNWYPGTGGCFIPVSQDDLAQASAASRKTVVRVLADLRRGNVIHTARGTIEILDIDELAWAADKLAHREDFPHGILRGRMRWAVDPSVTNLPATSGRVTKEKTPSNSYDRDDDSTDG